MKIKVNRFVSDMNTTLSTIELQTPSETHFECFGLEDEYRRHKVVGETRIPAGEYNIKLRRFGGFHDRYKHRFASTHDGMLEIADVPGFTDVLIHCGNTDDDTSGCLLLGVGANSEHGDMSISSSGVAYKRLYTKVVAAARADNLVIHIVDND